MWANLLNFIWVYWVRIMIIGKIKSNLKKIIMINNYDWKFTDVIKTTMC